jgi:hypothetical protein
MNIFSSIPIVRLISPYFFFVPNRLIWNNWERFNGEQDNPGDTTDFNIPQMTPYVPVHSRQGYLVLH